MTLSKSLQTKMKFCVALKEAVSKIEIHKDFDKLDVVIDSKENSFSVNYALIKKIPSVLIKPLNEYYSFNFYYNFIKKIIIITTIIIIIIIIAEENVLCCLRLKGDVQWINVPWILQSSDKLMKVET